MKPGPVKVSIALWIHQRHLAVWMGASALVSGGFYLSKTNILTIEDGFDLLPLDSNHEICASSFSFQPSNQVFGRDQYPSGDPFALASSSELYGIIPDQVSDTGGDSHFFSGPQPKYDLAPIQSHIPSLTSTLSTLSEASSSGKNAVESHVPEVPGPEAPGSSLRTAVSIRWPSSPGSADQEGRESNDDRGKRGRRKGSLPATKRIKVSKTRSIRACMGCALARVEVA